MLKKKRLQLIFFSIFIFINLSCEDSILGPETENTPENNFEILWKEFDLYYPSFLVKNINWDSLYSYYRPQVNLNSSETELWAIIARMISIFNDPHVWIYNRDHTWFNTSDHNSFRGFGEFRRATVIVHYLQPNYHFLVNHKVLYGKLRGDSIGYIHFSDFKETPDLFKQMKTVINYLYNSKAIIIDLRACLGGLLENYRYIASSFLDKPVTYLQSYSRNGPEHNNFTQPFFISLEPNDDTRHYTRRIVLLTDRQTVSSGELFTLVFKNLPYAVQIGDSTRGGLNSYERFFVLPNGWSYNMPTMLNLTVDGRCLENIGVSPDIYARNTIEEVADGYDRILETAIDYLKTRKTR